MDALHVVTLYGRPGCHLCDEARERLLTMLGGGHRFEFREIDIDDDEELLRRMLELIPVVELDGVLVSELVFEPDALIARLDTFPT